MIGSPGSELVGTFLAFSGFGPGWVRGVFSHPTHLEHISATKTESRWKGHEESASTLSHRSAAATRHPTSVLHTGFG